MALVRSQSTQRHKVVVMAFHGLLVARDIANMLRWAFRIPVVAVFSATQAPDLPAMVALCGSWAGTLPPIVLIPFKLH